MHRCAHWINLWISCLLRKTRNNFGSLTAHKWRCNVRRIGNNQLLLYLPLILHSEDVFEILWDRRIPFLWSEWSICHTRNPNEHSLMLSVFWQTHPNGVDGLDVVEIGHSSDSELNPLSLLLQHLSVDLLCVWDRHTNHRMDSIGERMDELLMLCVIFTLTYESLSV